MIAFIGRQCGRIPMFTFRDGPAIDRYGGARAVRPPGADRPAAGHKTVTQFGTDHPKCASPRYAPVLVIIRRAGP